MTRPGHTTLGILFMVGFSVIAPVMDTAAKLIGDSIAVAQVATTRFVFQAALLLPLAALLGAMHRPARAEMGLHLLRAALLLLATSMFFFSLRYMPVAEAISIFFVEPFILTLLGAWLLSEAIGPRRYIACAVGFAGALMIIRPTFQEVGPVALLPLGTAGLFALYMILTRRMALHMHPITLQAYTGCAALIIALPILMLFNGSGVSELDPSWPDARIAWLLGVVGLIATLSHVCISFALRFAPASTVAPLQYLEIVSATLLGFYVFGDIPDALTWMGIALIVGSGLFVFLRERHLERRPTPAP